MIERDFVAGDWIRFYQSSRTVIGEVVYPIWKQGVTGRITVYTDQGLVDAELVLEIRAKENRT